MEFKYIEKCNNKIQKKKYRAPLCDTCQIPFRTKHLPSSAIYGTQNSFNLQFHNETGLTEFKITFSLISDYDVIALSYNSTCRAVSLVIKQFTIVKKHFYANLFISNRRLASNKLHLQDLQICVQFFRTYLYNILTNRLKF